MKKSRILIIAALIIFGLAEISQAQIIVGRVRPRTGFPVWVADQTGTKLTVCTDGPLYCEPDPVVTNNRQSVKTGFGTFAYLYRATALAKPVTPTNVRVRADFSIQATYTGAPPVIAAGGQIVINSILIDFGGMPVDGVYTVDHPYGTHTVRVVGGRGRKSIQKVGALADSFQNAETGPITYFLKSLNPPADGRHIGRLAAQVVEGSPIRNNVVITGPANANIGGPAGDLNVLTINRMFIEGKVF